jgi:hypothetical protein
VTQLAKPISPAEFLSTAPKPLGGSSAYAAGVAAELRRIWTEDAARRPRDLQTHLGPSELGVECDRQVAGKMAANASTNHVVDPWPSVVGTALHAWAGDTCDACGNRDGVFERYNKRHGTVRYAAEQKVTPHPDHPGTLDLYDGERQIVVDHKFLGVSSMAKIRAGWPRKYLVQGVLYSLGWLRLGLPVRRFVLAAYPRTAGSLDGLYCRDVEITRDGFTLLPEVEAILQQTYADTARRRAQADEILAGRLRLDQVPHHPDDDECYFCPFYRPQAAHDQGPGCPGTAGRKTL